MEDLRSLAIGSPVPTPRMDDDVEIFTHDALDDESSKFPAIKIDRCVTDVRLDADRSSTSGQYQQTDHRRGQAEHRRAPSDHVVATKNIGVAPRSPTSNHAGPAKR